MILKLCGIAIISSILCAILKKTGALTLPVSLIGAVTVIMLSAGTLSEIITSVSDTLSPIGFDAYGTVMVKALGVALTVKISSDICRQCGEETLSGGIEFIGKIEMLALCMPIISSVLAAVKDLMS